MRSATRCIVRAAMGAALLVPVGGVAWAHGPGGSTESANDVDCNPAGNQQLAIAAGNYLYAGPSGVELCNEGTTNPSRGRIIVATGSGNHQGPGPYVAADGTYDNRQGGGSVRVSPPTKVTPPPPVNQTTPRAGPPRTGTRSSRGTRRSSASDPATRRTRTRPPGACCSGFFEVWIIEDLDAATPAERCLTCLNPGGLPPGNKGNPAFHPGGDWIVFQVEQPDHVGPQGIYYSSPGGGAYNDLWVIRPDGTAAHELVHHDLATPGRGSLHPVFDPSGEWLTWAQMIRGQGAPTDVWQDPESVLNDRAVNTTSGEWEIALASFSAGDATTPPSIRSVTTFQPGGRSFYGTHDLTEDAAQILYSNNPDPLQTVGALDIHELTTSTGAVTRLTDTPTGWEEHAHYTHNDRILYAAGSLLPHDDYPYPGPPVAVGAFLAAPQLDLWVQEGTADRRLTYFGDRDWASAHLNGSIGASVVDNSLSPDGTTIAALLLTRSIGPVMRQSQLQPLVLIHLDAPL